MAGWFAHTLRPAMLAAGRSDRLGRIVERSPLTRGVVRRFVPGDTLDDVVDIVTALRDSGRYLSIDYLGENVTDADDAAAAVRAYLGLLDVLGRRGDIACDGVRPLEVSLKLSALGQALDRDGQKIALDNARAICERAERVGAWVTVDAEDHTTTDSTLSISGDLRVDFPWLGTVVQAYLRRTLADCAELAAVGARVRLCKDFRCVAIDAPGCGLSDRLSTPPTLAQAADAITSVIDALQLRDLTLVAHDLGGPAGFLAAARRGDRVAALAAVNCFAWRPTGPLFRGMLAAMGSAPVRELDAAINALARATSTRFGAGRHWSRADRAAFRAGIDAPARRAWHAYFRDARRAHALYTDVDAALRGGLADRPLLTIFGQFNDPLRFQPRWKELFPTARQLQVRRGNHFPMCDDPDLVAGALTSFVQRST